MNEEVTLDAFEIINAAEEKELREKNMKRINEMFSKYQTSRLINDFGLTDSDFKKLKITGQIKPLINTSIYK